MFRSILLEDWETRSPGDVFVCLDFWTSGIKRSGIQAEIPVLSVFHCSVLLWLLTRDFCVTLVAAAGQQERRKSARPSTEIPLTEKPSTEITSIPDVTESDQLNQKLTVYKKALIGVSVGAGILLIVLIFYVMYLNDEKTNMESSQPKKGVYNSKKDNDYEMAADPGIDGNANEGFEAI
ncbi:uncharacterized protein LOC117294274 [Asterias rubens]|uniref:uncharacterized protein LOC117294274 n=1 Tax=Asterias rubens TaxID=7604 RepID=UPI001455AEE4|nr:uncharacterized protein LOC117294274 [Asterias rubens]